MSYFITGSVALTCCLNWLRQHVSALYRAQFYLIRCFRWCICMCGAEPSCEVDSLGTERRPWSRTTWSTISLFVLINTHLSVQGIISAVISAVSSKHSRHNTSDDSSFQIYHRTENSRSQPSTFKRPCHRICGNHIVVYSTTAYFYCYFALVQC